MDFWWENLRIHEPKIKTIVLCGNKTDLMDQRQVSIAEGRAKAKEFEMAAFFETSAMTGDNLEQAIFEIGEFRVLISREQLEPHFGREVDFLVFD